MRDVIIGAVGGFAALAFSKAVAEPVARAIGRKAIEPFIGPACELIDEAMLKIGVTCNPELIVREYLELDPETFSSEEVDMIVEEVFRRYDVRQIM